MSLVWRDDIIELDIADGAMASLRYKIQTYYRPLPPYNFFVVRYGTNVTDLINKDASLTVDTSLMSSNISTAVCSSSKCYPFPRYTFMGGVSI